MKFELTTASGNKYVVSNVVSVKVLPEEEKEEEEEHEKVVTLCSEQCAKGYNICCYDCPDTRACGDICDEEGPDECGLRMGEY